MTNNVAGDYKSNQVKITKQNASSAKAPLTAKQYSTLPYDPGYDGNNRRRQRRVQWPRW